ncbi:ADP-ribose diphosphatase [Acrasis kona]|uniref:ADP-ribose diphosphatase n=1 Tax=Acrasis kona TaxID=1008807 RepID=A0AAW2ZIB8_9EUKA
MSTEPSIQEIAKEQETHSKSGEITERLKPEVESSEVLHSGFLRLIKDTLKLPPSYQKRYEYYKLDTKGLTAVSVIARVKDSDNHLINIEYRHPTTQFLVGAPGGVIDKGESIITAAQRELLEETGYINHDLSKYVVVGSCFPWPSVTDLKLYFVAVHDVEYEKPPELEPSENLQVQLMSTQQIQDILKSQSKDCTIDGSFTTAWLYYTLHSLK